MPEKKKPDRNSIEIFIYPKFVREDKFGSFIPYSFNEILSTLLHDEYQNLYCSVDKEKGIMRFTVRNATRVSGTVHLDSPSQSRQVRIGSRGNGSPGKI